MNDHCCASTMTTTDQSGSDHMWKYWSGVKIAVSKLSSSPAHGRVLGSMVWYFGAPLSFNEKIGYSNQPAHHSHY